MSLVQIGTVQDLFGVDLPKTASKVCDLFNANVSKFIDNGTIAPLLLTDDRPHKWSKYGHRIYFIDRSTNTMYYKEYKDAMCHASVRDFYQNIKYKQYFNEIQFNKKDVVPVLIQTVAFPKYDIALISTEDADLYYRSVLLNTVVSHVYVNPRTDSMMQVLQSHGMLTRTNVQDSLLYTALIYIRFVQEKYLNCAMAIALHRKGIPLDMCMMLCMRMRARYGKPPQAHLSWDSCAHTAWSYHGASVKVLAAYSKQYLEDAAKPTAMYCNTLKLRGAVDRYTPSCSNINSYYPKLAEYVQNYATEVAKTYSTSYYTMDSFISAVLMYLQAEIFPLMKGAPDV